MIIASGPDAHKWPGTHPKWALIGRTGANGTRN